MKVHEFPLAPSLQEDTKIAVAQQTETAAPANLHTTPRQLADWLVDDGFQKEARVRGANEIGVEDTAGNFDGEDVEAVLAELHALITDDTDSGDNSGGSSAPKYKSFTPDGAIIGVYWFGAAEPTVTGTAGNYTVTFEDGTAPRSITATVTGTSNLTLTVAGDRNYYAALQFTDLADGKRFGPGQRGISPTEVDGSNQVANNIPGIGAATSGYRVKFTF